MWRTLRLDSDSSWSLVFLLLGVCLTAGFMLGCSSSVGSPGSTVKPSPAAALDYPVAQRSEQVDTYHGQRVADPYRWMENVETPEVGRWIAAQEALLDGYVGAVPRLEALRDQIQRIREFDRVGTPTRRGDRYFFTETKAGAQHGQLMVMRGLNGKPRLLIDFNDQIGDDNLSVGGTSVSHNGRYVVWSRQSPKRWGWLEVSGMDGKTRVRDQIDGIAGNSAIWTHDNKGFFYLHYGETAALETGADPQPKINYHRLGTPQSEDRLIYQQPDNPNLLFSMKLSDDGHYLVVSLFDGTRKTNRVIYKDARDLDAEFVSLIDEPDAAYTFEGNVGKRLLFQTTLNAPRGRLIAVNLNRPQRQHWDEVIPERESTLASVSHIGGRLVVRSTVDARPVVEVFKTNGTLERKLELPSIGGIGGFSDDPASSTSFYRFNSLYDPGTVYRVDLTTGKSTVFQRPELSHNPDDFETRQVFYRSKDGTRVPMFIAHRRGLKLDGTNPAFMYGFGHGGWIAFPWFQPHLVAWLELGGVYALPGLRGGGEYGAEWQEAGTRQNKQNTIDDYLAAAEWLIDKKYTSAAKLVANGGSGSGVLAAAAVVQRPELFGAALVEWPFLDMLRYHKFTLVKGWTGGYGTVEDQGDFDILRTYSPVHSLKEGTCYPAILTVVGEEDLSTVPMHGYKFTAALQDSPACDHPYLLKFIPDGGHYSYGTTPEESVQTQAEIIAFLIRALDV